MKKKTRCGSWYVACGENGFRPDFKSICLSSFQTLFDLVDGEDLCFMARFNTAQDACEFAIVCARYLDDDSEVKLEMVAMREQLQTQARENASLRADLRELNRKLFSTD